MITCAIIPTLNESVDELRERINGALLCCQHAVVVCSRDRDTGALEESLGVEVIEQDGHGAGDAYRCGIAGALLDPNVTHVAMIDADSEADLSTLPALLLAAKKADVAVASRWLPESRIVGYRPDKLALNWAFNKIFRIALGSPVHDHTFTFKVLSRRVAEGIRWTADRQDIGAETTMLPVALGYCVAEVPTAWVARKGASKGTLSLAGNLRHVVVGLRAVAVSWSGVRVP